MYMFNCFNLLNALYIFSICDFFLLLCKSNLWDYSKWYYYMYMCCYYKKRFSINYSLEIRVLKMWSDISQLTLSFTFNVSFTLGSIVSPFQCNSTRTIKGSVIVDKLSLSLIININIFINPLYGYILKFKRVNAKVIGFTFIFVY